MKNALSVVAIAIVAVAICSCSSPAEVVVPPPSPVELHVTEGHDGSVLLFWTPAESEGFVRYDIFESTISGELGEYLGSNFEVSDCSRIHNGLEPETLYFFCVVVVGEGGEAPSNVVAYSWSEGSR